MHFWSVVGSSGCDSADQKGHAIDNELTLQILLIGIFLLAANLCCKCLLFVLLFCCVLFCFAMVFFELFC